MADIGLFVVTALASRFTIMGNKASSTPTIPTAFDIVKDKDLKGKTILITGAYSGLGASSTKALLSVGAKVIVAGRSQKLQDEFVDELSKTYDKSLIDGTHLLDLNDLNSVKEFSKYIKDTYKTIDVLLCNAGVMATPPGKTIQGYEVQMGINGIGHFLLCKNLVNITKRQVWVSSGGHYLVGNDMKFDRKLGPRINIEKIEQVESDASTYEAWHRYQQSKLANVLLAKEFGNKFKNLESCSCHPGLVSTNLGRHMSLLSTKLLFPLFITLGMMSKPRTSEEGASTQVLCCVTDTLKQGAYYADCDVAVEGDNAKLYPEDAVAIYEYCDKVTKEYQI